MMTSRFSTYYLKKWFALWPGVVAPVAAGFLTDHYNDRRAARSIPRAALDALVGLGFRAWVPFRARAVARKYGLGPEWARKAARIARARFADPNDIALFRIEQPDQLDLYIRRFENAPVSKRINPAGWRVGCALADKSLFYQRCRDHDLPHPRVLATLQGGAWQVAALPREAVVALKPHDGEGGDGFRLIDVPAPIARDPSAFRAWLDQEHGGLKGVWIVQDRAVNHPAMADIVLNALATVRTTTMINEAGEPEIVTAVLRFASRAESLVDNIKAGGLISPVDIETGTLGPACQGRGVGEFDVHPVSGAKIEGRQLPFWPEARALVARAHRAFPEYTLVGWDVAITPDGPILIEGNAKPCMIVAQRANRRGIGATRFGALLKHHLARSA